MMIHTCEWINKRNHLGYKYENDPVLNRYIENFSCSSNDDYSIEGEMGMPLPPFVAKFSTNILDGNIVAVADEDGRVRLINSNKFKTTSTLKEWSAHSNAVFDLAWIEEESKLITASGDQTARLWDIEKAETLAIFRGHTCSLKSVAVQPKSKCIFITGARDGNILQWDTRCFTRNGYSNPMNTIRNAHIISQKDGTPTGKKKKTKKSPMNGYSKQSVTSVVFQDNYTVISSGACDGELKFWDLRRSYTNHKANPVAFHVIQYPGKGSRKYGYSSLLLDSTCSRLYTVCTNNTIYEYVTTNLSTQPVQLFEGHQTSSFYVKAAISPDDKFLLCGSSDNDAHIWRTDGTCSSPWLLKGHSSEVTSVAWAPNEGEKIVTCSDDNSLKIWRLFQPEKEGVDRAGYCELKQVQKPDTLKDVIPETVKLKQEEVLPEIIPPENESKKPPQPILPKRKSSVTAAILQKPNTRLHEIMKTPDIKAKLNDTFTKLTPKTTIGTPSSNHTPQFRLKTPTRLTRCQSEPLTPRSSRSFMETWLKSPSSPKESPAFSDISLPITSSKKLINSSIDNNKNELTNSNKNENNTTANKSTPLITNNLISDVSSKNEKCHTKIISKPNTPNSTKKVTRKKREIKTPSGNIRSLLMAGVKRSAIDSPENDKRTTKRFKQGKENDIVFIKSCSESDDDVFYDKNKNSQSRQSNQNEIKNTTIRQPGSGLNVI